MLEKLQSFGKLILSNLFNLLEDRCKELDKKKEFDVRTPLDHPTNWTFKSQPLGWESMSSLLLSPSEQLSCCENIL
jgi:hypothetical protein